MQAVGGVVAVLAIGWLLAQQLFGLKLLNVQTGSMRPTFRQGDALVMQRTRREQLAPGIVVSYRSPRNPNELVTHRVVRVLPGARSFQTKGDALSVPDPAVNDSLLAGRVVAVLPGLGRLLGWMASWPGLIVCVYIPAAAIAVSELARLERHYQRKNSYRPDKAVVV